MMTKYGQQTITNGVIWHYDLQNILSNYTAVIIDYYYYNYNYNYNKHILTIINNGHSNNYNNYNNNRSDYYNN